MTAFMTYKEECEALRQQIAEKDAEIWRLGSRVIEAEEVVTAAKMEIKQLDRLRELQLSEAQRDLAKKETEIHLLQMALADTEALELGTAERLAAANAEIARLKEDVAIEAANGRHWSDAYSEWVKSDKVAQKLIEYEAKNWLLETQLAASQLREQQLREALEYKHDALEALMLWCVKNINKWHFSQYDNCAFALRKMKEALALPQNTSALEVVVAKAGEAMRERCVDECDEAREAIRALPGVTLEDLK